MKYLGLSQHDSRGAVLASKFWYRVGQLTCYEFLAQRMRRPYNIASYGNSKSFKLALVRHCTYSIYKSSSIVAIMYLQMIAQSMLSIIIQAHPIPLKSLKNKRKRKFGLKAAINPHTPFSINAEINIGLRPNTSARLPHK